MKMYVVGTLVCAATLFAVVACEKDEEKKAAAPAAAGAISGASENTCPATTVALSVAAIDGATAYQWYNGTAKISGATAVSYTVAESGSYTVAGVNEQGEGAKSAVKVVAITPCAAAAGAITGPTSNPCPADSVTLTISAIEGAVSYKWYRDDSYTGVAGQSYTTKTSGTFTVAGVNSKGNEGEKSAPHVVTITTCAAPLPAAAGSITGPSSSECPVTSVDLSIAAIENATSYQWYRNDAVISGATAITYTVTQTGYYTVAGVNSDLTEGTKSPSHQVIIAGVAGKPAAVSNGPNSSATYSTNCSTSGGTMTVSLNGQISLNQPTSYTWYITRDGGQPEALITHAYDTDNFETIMHYTATATGLYTTTGSNACGESEHSTGFYVEIKTVANCTPTDPPVEAPGSFRISTGTANKTENADGSWSNACDPNEAKSLALAWNAVNGAGSYIVKNHTTGVETVRSATQRTHTVNLNFSGTYTVRARNIIGDGPETEQIVINIVECPPAAPQLAKKSSDNLCPATSVVVELGYSNSAASFSWYKDDSTTPAGTVPQDPVSNTTFTITESGSYTVRGIAASGLEGKLTESFPVTISACPSAPTGTSNFTGAWDVADLKAGPVVGTVPWTYEVTIADAGSGSITISNFAAATTVTAVVNLGGEYANASRYGTITIPEQSVTVGGETATFSKMTSNFFGTSYGGDVTADISAVGGKLYFKLKDKFAVRDASDNVLVRSHPDNADALAAFTKK
jgi:hypothetical protein